MRQAAKVATEHPDLEPDERRLVAAVNAAGKDYVAAARMVRRICEGHCTAKEATALVATVLEAQAGQAPAAPVTDVRIRRLTDELAETARKHHAETSRADDLEDRLRQANGRIYRLEHDGNQVDTVKDLRAEVERLQKDLEAAGAEMARLQDEALESEPDRKLDERLNDTNDRNLRALDALIDLVADRLEARSTEELRSLDVDDARRRLDDTVERIHETNAKRQPTNDGTKVCVDCGETKPVTDFYVQRSNRDGRQTRCKPCWTTKYDARSQRRKDTA